MRVIEARRAVADGLVPWSIHSIYQWSHRRKYPKLLFNLEGKLLIDMDEMDDMLRAAQEANTKEAQRIRRPVAA